MHLAAAFLLDKISSTARLLMARSQQVLHHQSLSLCLSHTHTSKLLCWWGLCSSGLIFPCTQSLQSHQYMVETIIKEDLYSRVPTGRSGFQAPQPDFGSLKFFARGQTELYELFKISRAHFMELFERILLRFLFWRSCSISLPCRHLFN